MELSLTFREYPDFVYQVFLGAPAVTNAAEAGGSASSPENKSGALIEATTGIADISVEAGAEADLKTTKYIVKAVGAATIDVFSAHSAAFLSDDLKIASAILVPDAGGTVSIPGTGLEITGGSGTVALSVGDTAAVETKAINSSSYDVTVGATADSVPDFGAIVVSAKDGGALTELDLYRCRAGGLPISLNENAYSEASVTAECYYDSVRDGVFSMRRVED